jgi:hypothetical protein
MAMPTRAGACSKVPPSRAVPNLECAAKCLDPAAHGGDANSAHIRLVQPNPVIGYPHDQLAGRKGYAHIAVLGVGMPDHVVQRLEYDEIGTLGYGCRQRSGDVDAESDMRHLRSVESGDIVR